VSGRLSERAQHAVGNFSELRLVPAPPETMLYGTVTDQVDYLTADEEDRFIIAQANIHVNEDGTLTEELVSARHGERFLTVRAEQVDYMDVSPKQTMSVAGALIPFLEHDDANRALMGSNMQRQAVPLLKTDAPVVGTGMERRAALDTGDVVLARNAGTIDFVDATRIVVATDSGSVRTENHRQRKTVRRSGSGADQRVTPVQG